MAFDPHVFNPIYFTFLDATADPSLEIMLVLREVWGLSGSLASGSIKFSTGPYDNRFQAPQIVVTPMTSDKTMPMSMGSTASYYQDTENIKIDIYVRPSSDSNSSFGSAKNTLSLVKNEVERIIRSGSRFNTSTEERLLVLNKWIRTDLMGVTPPILKISNTITMLKTFKGVE